mgnify:CR=1 FL=1
MKNREATLSNYAEAVVDGMDLKTLCQFATECIIEQLHDYTDEDLIELIEDYDEDNAMGIIE